MTRPALCLTRIRPGNRNAAWNLEYALQRIREEEQKQEQRQEQEQEQEQNQEQEQEQGQEQSGNENESPPMQPSEVERFLDALEQNEESLPLQRARQRSAGRRPPEKDW